MKKYAGLEEVWNSYPNKDELPFKTTAEKKRKFKEVLKTFNYLFMKAVVDTGYSYRLPSRNGRILVVKRKSKRKIPDMAHYRKTGVWRYHDNKHTDGYYASIRWLKYPPYSIVRNASIYKFRPSTGMKKYLYHSITENNTMIKYYED